MIDKFIASYAQAPKQLILDFDATEDEIHGKQEEKHYNGYYRHNCFLLWAWLKTRGYKAYLDHHAKVT
jgi:hypothetical protein